MFKKTRKNILPINWMTPSVSHVEIDIVLNNMLLYCYEEDLNLINTHIQGEKSHAAPNSVSSNNQSERKLSNYP